MKSAYAFTSEPAALRGMRAWLKDVLVAGGITPGDMDAIILAVDEACTNVIRHAYGSEAGHPIRVRIDIGPRRVRCVVRDFGAPCDVSRIPVRPHQQLRPGGFGVQIMREVFQRVEYRARPIGTELLLVFARQQDFK